jgi:hypothetical protein
MAVSWFLEGNGVEALLGLVDRTRVKAHHPSKGTILNSGAPENIH